MYKDNGTVDVALLADVGYISNRVRHLDEKLVTLTPNPLDANTAQILCHQASGSAASGQQSCNGRLAKLSSCIDSNDDVKASEQIINKFYDTHQNYHRDRERAAVAKHFREKSPSKLCHLTNGGDTMNNTNRVESENISNTSELPAAASADIEASNVADAASSTASTSNVCDDDSASAQRAQLKRQQTSRGSFSQPMPEIQISSSEDTDERKNSADQIQVSPVSPSSPLNYDNRSAGSCSHYCGGWQSSICTDQLNDEDLRKLVLELKQRVEFTERMNWLCECEVST